VIPPCIQGSIAPVYTAFAPDGQLDHTGQRELLDFLVESGSISAYFLRCGMGQMFAFSYDEVKAFTRNVCGHMADKGPVLIGASGIWNRDRDNPPDPETYTRQAVELSRFAEDHGARGVVHVMPEGLPPRDGETPGDVILRYFTTVSQAVSVPLFIYQTPGTLQEYLATVELVQKLADLPNVAGMKASTAHAGYILDMTWATRDKEFAYIVGNETGWFAGLHSGARAVIGQGATMNPEILNAVEERVTGGDIQGAMDAQRSVNMLVRAVRNSDEFFKRYVAEQGKKLHPHRRTGGASGYPDRQRPLTPSEYDSMKRIYETERQKYQA
jgi:4-hydroxy-tetrahydrodipicolinate synthase